MVYASLSVGGACLFKSHPASDALACMSHLVVMAVLAKSGVMSCMPVPCNQSTRKSTQKRKSKSWSRRGYAAKQRDCSCS